jgi:hypothetical protein
MVGNLDSKTVQPTNRSEEIKAKIKQRFSGIDAGKNKSGRRPKSGKGI